MENYSNSESALQELDFSSFSGKKPNKLRPIHFGKKPTLRAGSLSVRAILHHAIVHQMIPNFQDYFSSHIESIYKW